MLTATVSGSFHRHLTEICTAVGELREVGVSVLSPSDPRVVDHLDEFLFVASDRVRSIRLVQDRHLQCIGASTFLWLVAPDGYLGSSASMEIGYAIARNRPIFCANAPSDATLKQYVRVVPGIHAAIQEAQQASNVRPRQAVLIAPQPQFEALFAAWKRFKARSILQTSRSRPPPIASYGARRRTCQRCSTLRAFRCPLPRC